MQRRSVLSCRHLFPVLIALLLAGLRTSTHAEDSPDAVRRAFFQYDRALPLNAKLTPKDSTAARDRFLLAYDSAHDQRVTSILAVPKGKAGPFPAVVLMHGAGGDKDVDYIRALSDMLTRQGFVTLSLDAQYRGDRVRPGKSGELRPDSYEIRDAWIQTVIDQRRAIDYLESRPDIDRTKIGYLGISMGGMLGAILGGVEPRVSCFFLGVPGGGLVNVVKNIDRYPLLKSRWPVERTPEVMARVEDIASVLDPIHYAGGILPRPLLIIVAKRDEVIPPEMSDALIAAAGAKEGEHIKRVDSGHAILNAVFDAQRFFLKHLGKKVAARTQ